MAQIGRPNSDISVGSWSPYPADPTTLFDKIDEETPNDDSDYIVSSTDEDECEFSLTGVTAPIVKTGHKIRCYARSVAGAGAGEQMYIALVENGTVRGQSPATNTNRTGYAVIEYVLSEAEANAIQNYANLRLRFHITKTDADEPIRITQAEFECPDGVTEFVYSGDIPVSVLPDAPKASLSKSYDGDIPLSVLPGYSSTLTMIYAGAVGLVLIPNSAYELTEGGNEYVYVGNIPMTVLPAYASILERAYKGDIPVVVVPSYSSTLDRVYSGNIGLMLVPNSIYRLSISGAKNIYGRFYQFMTLSKP